MDKKYVISGISKIRNEANRFLEEKLNECNLDGFVASHGSIISVLFRNNGSLTMGEIARIVGKDKSTITKLIEKLIEKGYVIKEKSVEDKRVTYIKLTNKSWEIQDDFNRISSELNNKAYNGFTEKEAETLVVLLDRMLRNFMK